MNPRLILHGVALATLAATLGATPAPRPASSPAALATRPASQTAAKPSSQPASQPAANLPDLTSRQQNLLLQLSDAEANIQAINKALTVTGYKVGMAYNSIDSNLKGNELMNRNGGGPVRWDAFYGKTAKGFGTNFWGDRQPKPFTLIYQANNDQIARAKDQIASLAKDQAALLARRKKHESDQCSLWATLAWEQIKDREISLHPLSRFALAPRGPEAAVLRPVILFLRTADRVAVEGIDSVEADQNATFQIGTKRMDGAYAALQRSLADALDVPNLTPDHKKQGETLKALCKNVADECKVIDDNSANALDRDQAKEDNSKLQFRGLLQASLANFSQLVGQLDDEIARTAQAWGLNADKTMPTPDAVPLAPIATGKPGTAGAPGAPGALADADTLPAPPANKQWKLTWHDEFDGAALDTAKWTCSNDEKEVNSWTSKDAVSLDNSGHLVITTRKVGARLVTGSLTSAGKFEHAFGYYACRLQFQKQPGFRSCFILNCDSMSKPGIHGRDGSRIFVAAKESVDDALRQFINRNGEGGPNNANGITTRTMTTAGLRDGWHTVGLWWTPEQYVFYIDGKETWRDTARNISQVPQYIELCTQVLPLAGNINNAKLPDACQVDYVRVYDTVDK